MVGISAGSRSLARRCHTILNFGFISVPFGLSVAVVVVVVVVAFLGILFGAAAVASDEQMNVGPTPRHHEAKHR